MAILKPMIHGTDVDKSGRCAHYHSEADVIANLCATCHSWWACYKCHAEANTGHDFGRPSKTDNNTVCCGACGHLMGYQQYSHVNSCPGCGHIFNPGCALHTDQYFQP